VSSVCLCACACVFSSVLSVTFYRRGPWVVAYVRGKMVGPCGRCEAIISSRWHCDPRRCHWDDMQYETCVITTIEERIKMAVTRALVEATLDALATKQLLLLWASALVSGPSGLPPWMGLHWRIDGRRQVFNHDHHHNATLSSSVPILLCHLVEDS